MNNKLLLALFIISLLVLVYSTTELTSNIVIHKISRTQYYTFSYNYSQVILIHFKNFGDYTFHLNVTNNNINQVYAIVIVKPIMSPIILKRNVITLSSLNNTYVIFLHPGKYVLEIYISGIATKNLTVTQLRNYISITLYKS